MGAPEEDAVGIQGVEARDAFKHQAMQKQSLQQRIIQPNALLVLMFGNPGLKPWTFKDYVVLLRIFHSYAMPFGEELSTQKHSSCLGVHLPFLKQQILQSFYLKNVPCSLSFWRVLNVLWKLSKKYTSSQEREFVENIKKSRFLVSLPPIWLLWTKNWTEAFGSIGTMPSGYAIFSYLFRNVMKCEETAPAGGIIYNFKNLKKILS